jgi:hypothetical protein
MLFALLAAVVQTRITVAAAKVTHYLTVCLVVRSYGSLNSLRSLMLNRDVIERSIASLSTSSRSHIVVMLQLVRLLLLLLRYFGHSIALLLCIACHS